MVGAWSSRQPALDLWRTLPAVAWRGHAAYFGSILILYRLLSYQERIRSGFGSQLEQPGRPVGPINQVLVTSQVGVWRLDLLCARRRIELLEYMIVLSLKRIILIE